MAKARLMLLLLCCLVLAVQSGSQSENSKNSNGVDPHLCATEFKKCIPETGFIYEGPPEAPVVKKEEKPAATETTELKCKPLVYTILNHCIAENFKPCYDPGATMEGFYAQDCARAPDDPVNCPLCKGGDASTSDKKCNFPTCPAVQRFKKTQGDCREFCGGKEDDSGEFCDCYFARVKAETCEEKGYKEIEDLQTCHMAYCHFAPDGKCKHSEYKSASFTNIYGFNFGRENQNSNGCEWYEQKVSDGTAGTQDFQKMCKYHSTFSWISQDELGDTGVPETMICIKPELEGLDKGTCEGLNEKQCLETCQQKCENSNLCQRVYHDPTKPFCFTQQPQEKCTEMQYFTDSKHTALYYRYFKIFPGIPREKQYQAYLKEVLEESKKSKNPNLESKTAGGTKKAAQETDAIEENPAKREYDVKEAERGFDSKLKATDLGNTDTTPGNDADSVQVGSKSLTMPTDIKHTEHPDGLKHPYEEPNVQDKPLLKPGVPISIPELEFDAEISFTYILGLSTCLLYGVITYLILLDLDFCC